MLFSSFEFIYLFLPVVLAVFFLLRHLRQDVAIIWWLIVASFGFYAWWSPKHLLLLLASIAFNYVLHIHLLKNKNFAVLCFGVASNLLVLCIFKYADFVLQNLAALGGTELARLGLILPLAISFFTFQQISFLVDTYRSEIEKTEFSKYVLFVSFFPQLIAGPIIRQRDTVPQFRPDVMNKSVWLNLSVGSTLFAIGLFKKLVLADGIAPVANVVFDGAESGAIILTTDAWIGALAYTFQLYFDFSGYCDMALGLARMFGIRLPINFNSPYKSLSITEFWRRWHISLSRFLRDYLYIPLGGNRRGVFGSSGNLIITMLLGGLWHGAGWTFVVWGALHGGYLVVNHAWRKLVKTDLPQLAVPRIITYVLSWSLTMIAVIVAWVFFRAESLGSAVIIVQAMFGLTSAGDTGGVPSLISNQAYTCAALVVMFVMTTSFPNSIEITRNYRPVLGTISELSENLWVRSTIVWRPTATAALAVGGVALISLVQMYRLNELTEFLYFNF